MKHRLQHWLAVTSFPIVVGLLAGPSSAGINDVFGDAILMAPPPSVVPEAFFSDTTVIHSFVERRNIVLDVDIVVDLVPVGPIVIIPVGTCVTSHLIHYDPGPPSIVLGGIQFESPILGVIDTQALLDSSNDALGLDATAYPTLPDCLAPLPNTGDCALESVDSIDVQAQRIDVEFHASGLGDRVRVITEGDPALCFP